MKRIALFVLVAWSLTVPSVSAQMIPVAGEHPERANPTQNCGVGGLSCEMVAFVSHGTGTHPTFAAMLVQRMTSDIFTIEAMMSDRGAMDYFTGLRFYDYMDYTAEYDLLSYATPTPVWDQWEYRVFEGQSDLIGTREKTVVFMLRSPEDVVYAVTAVNPPPVVETYVVGIINGEDWTEEPRGFRLLDG